jgi:hypothetical protein
MSRRPQSVRQLLDSKPLLQQIERHVAQQQRLLDDVRRVLPAEVSPHCVAAQRDGDILTLHADSPVWAMRLRYLAPGLSSLLQSGSGVPPRIRVRIHVPNARRPTRPHQVRRSDAAAATIRDGAMDIDSPALRAALLRLSKAVAR